MVSLRKISVIVPIYNTRDYLDEAIQSVVSQNIGFEDNIQLILVNDGSTDGSEKICLKYKELYSDNVVYINKENGGVSTAINVGLEYADGRYVAIMGSDDKWTEDAFKQGHDFFERHYDEIDVLGFRMRYFDARSDYHGLDYKFDGDKVVDILKDYSYIQLHTSALIKREAIGELRFDENVKFSEDSKFLGTLILQKGKLGLISSAQYLYRRRTSALSAVQESAKDRAWYFDTPTSVYDYLIELSKQRFGRVISYVQYVIMYDLQYRLKEGLPNDFSDSELACYKRHIEVLLDQIDYEIIFAQKNLPLEYKLHTARMKYGGESAPSIKIKSDELWFGDLVALNVKDSPIRVIALRKSSSRLKIEGRTSIFMLLDKKTTRMYFLVGGSKNELRKISLDYFLYPKSESFSLGEKLGTVQRFCATLPAGEAEEAQLVVEDKAGRVVLDWELTESSGIRKKFKVLYCFYLACITIPGKIFRRHAV